MIGIDANVFIYVLESNPEYVDNCVAILKRIESTDIGGLVSELIYLEILSGDNIDIKKHKLKVENLIRDIGIQAKPVDKAVLIYAAQLRRDYRLKTPDAIHLATAIIHKANAFVTNDKALLVLESVNGVKILSIKDAAHSKKQ